MNQRNDNAADEAPDIPPVERIDPALESLAVDVAALVLDPANARTHDGRNLDAIKGSLALFGQRKPIVVRRHGNVVIAGNGTLTAARSLGWKRIAAVVVDDDAAMATAYGIADNRTAELAKWDEEILGTLLGGLQDTPIKMEHLGFNVNEQRELISALDFQPGKESDQGALDEKAPVVCPKCGHAFHK